jgi:membrane-bound lytic murein transglycosylase MltF
MKQIFVSALVGALVAAAVLGALMPRAGGDRATTAAAPESAYDRVIRTGTLRCGYMAWPPSFERDLNTGVVTGWGADIVRKLGEILNLKIEFVEIAGASMNVEELKRGVYDTYCTDSYYTFASVRYVDYGQPYMYVPMFVYARAGDARFKTVDALNNADVTFVGMDGDLSTSLVAFKFPQAKLMPLAANADPATLMINVATKKADVAILDPGLVEIYNRNNQPGLRVVGTGDPVAVYPISFSVAKGEDELKDMLDGATSALVNTGVIRDILRAATKNSGGIPVGYAASARYEVVGASRP